MNWDRPETTQWWDGASRPITVNQAAATVVITSGPGVITGGNLFNQGGAQETVTIQDGNGQPIYNNTIAANSRINPAFPDRGVYFETELQLVTTGAGPTTGALYVRTRKQEYQMHYGERSSDSLPESR